MIKRVVFILFIFTSVLPESYSQKTLLSPNEHFESTKRNINLTYGLAYNIAIDRTYSRLPKKGLCHIFKLGYNISNNTKIFDIQGQFMTGELKTLGNNINRLTKSAMNLDIRYLIRIIKNQNRFILFTGIKTGLLSDIWFPKGSHLRYGWDIATGISTSTILKYIVYPKLTIYYGLDISLVGVLWRSHNNGQQLITEEVQLENGTSASAFEVSRFAYLFNTSYIDNTLRLDFDYSDKINFYCDLLISYKHIKQPLLKKGYEIGNLFGIKYKFQ